MEYLTGNVSRERLERSLKYRFEADRKRSMLAHVLLGRAVSEKYPDMEIPVCPVTDEYGKPHLYMENEGCPDKGKEIFFSLSHSGDHAVCVISDVPIGVDIEVIGEEKDKIAERFFADIERQYVCDDESFFRIWTLKESLMKVVGLGMHLPMDSFSVTDFNKETGTCRYILCPGDSSRSSSTLSPEIMNRLKPFIDDGGNLKISGTSQLTVPGYALSYAVADP